MKYKEVKYCWVCGKELPLIQSKYYDRYTGKLNPPYHGKCIDNDTCSHFHHKYKKYWHSFITHKRRCEICGEIDNFAY